MLRGGLDLSKIRPLDRALWAGAVDNLGGDVLAWIASTMKQNGTIASIGLAASMSLNTTVAPFILRRRQPARIDSGYCAMPLRRRVWERLAGDLRPRIWRNSTRTVASTLSRPVSTSSPGQGARPGRGRHRGLTERGHVRQRAGSAPAGAHSSTTPAWCGRRSPD